MKDVEDLDLPLVFITERTLPEGWEMAVVECWERGVEIRTQYDKPGDPPSCDVTLCLSVAEPFSEPRIHRAMPGGIYDLEIYTQEVCDGVHDHWIDMSDPQKWHYTYHERLTDYRQHSAAEAAGCDPVDQLAQVVNKLAEDPNTRQAQAIIWKPWCDPYDAHSPCLQRLWFRLVGDRLVMNAHIRSNDAFKAGFMNMYAFTALQARIAQQLAERMERPIVPGQYNHIADSFHIYGSYFEDFRGFLETLKTRTFEQRTYTTEEVAPLFEEAREKIVAKLAAESR